MSNWPTSEEFVRRTQRHAANTAKTLGLPVVSTKLASRRFQEARVDASMVASTPEYGRLRVNEAINAHMSCLFIDMVGSTSRKRRDPTANDFVVNQTYLNTVTWLAVSERASGRLAGYRGDGAFFVWPYKTSFSPHWIERKVAVRRSVATARQMQSAIRNHVNPVLAEAGIPPVHASVGIHTGHVLVARCGANEAVSELTIVGKAADLASKFADAAKSGEILIEAGLDELFETTPGGLLRFLPRRVGDRSGLLVQTKST